MQRKLRWLENNWLAGKAAQIQSYANINDTKSSYEALKGVYGPRRFSLHPVRSTDGVLIKNKELILKIWAEYLQNLLNKVHTTDLDFLNDLPTLPIIPKLDDPPSFVKVEKAILSVKDNKAAGPDNIPAEVIKYGGYAFHRRLHNFILDCWTANKQYKNANIILVHKQKGDRDAVADISILQCSAQFRILIINAHFVADNAYHALASSATAKPTFSVEEEVVVIRNGWTPKKKMLLLYFYMLSMLLLCFFRYNATLCFCMLHMLLLCLCVCCICYVYVCVCAAYATFMSYGVKYLSSFELMECLC